MFISIVKRISIEVNAQSYTMTNCETITALILNFFLISLNVQLVYFLESMMCQNDCIQS